MSHCDIWQRRGRNAGERAAAEQCEARKRELRGGKGESLLPTRAIICLVEDHYRAQLIQDRRSELKSDQRLVSAADSGAG